MAQAVLAERPAPAPRAPAARTGPRARRRSAGPWVLTAVGLVAWWAAVASARPAAMGNLGLSTVLGWPYLVAVLAVAGALAWELASPHPQPLVPVVALVVVLFATAPAIEVLPRLPTSWVHAGFINYIATHGRVLPDYDARFSWPGFFALGAVLDAVTGRHDPTVFLRWAPVAFELAYLAPLRVIARATVADQRAGWIGTAVFYAANWIDQDYFSPQALGMLFFLVVLAAVLAFWRPRPVAAPVGGWTLRRWWRGLGQVDPTLGAARQIGLEVLLIVVVTACVVAHQFTPYALVVALAACVATRRLPGPELPLLVGVLAVGWLSLATADFWSGHLSLLFGGTGDLRAALGQNVGRRVTGAPAHRLIIDLRFGLALVVGALALVAVLGRRGQNRALELLAVTPFLLLGAASYGGEALLRCFLFSLPFGALLAGLTLARLVAPAHAERRWRVAGVVALAAVIAVLGLWLTVVRGGNDAFESFGHDDRAAVLAVYQVAQPGQRLAATTPSTDQLPWRDQGLGRWSFIDPATATSAQAVAGSLLAQRADWVVMTRNEERWGELVAGLPVGWQASVARQLEARGYTVYRRWPTAEVLRRP